MAKKGNPNPICGKQTRFKKGQSGNPGGAWSKKPWMEALRKILGERAKDGNGTKLDEVARACYASALEGDVSAIKEIGERFDGKTPQALTGEGGGPVQVKVVHTFKSGI